MSKRGLNWNRPREQELVRAREEYKREHGYFPEPAHMDDELATWRKEFGDARAMEMLREQLQRKKSAETG